MKKILIAVLIFTVLFILVQCDAGGADLTNYASSKINVSISLKNLENQAGISEGTTRADVQVNITPTQYTMAIVNFWFVKKNGTEVNIINPDSANPTYTEANPLIIDFTNANSTYSLISNADMEGGVYTGYKIQFVYLGMRYPVTFHVPDELSGDETDYLGDNIATILDIKQEYDFRLYFNAIGQYWKRDFIVELDQSTDQWYWLRRQVTTNEFEKNFFIKTSPNTHPDGDGAPTSTIDLFDDIDFWGPITEYASSVDPIIIGTHSTAGGVNASMPHPFTIDGTDATLTLDVDVFETMNFQEPDVSSDVNEIGSFDLGPEYDGGFYGDFGLHPFMPRFEVKVQ